MNALVTGANGFVGSHVCETLLSAGHAVRALVRETSDLTWLEGLELELVYGDLRKRETLESAARDAEWVFHTAATVRPRNASDFERVNREGTHVLAEVCAASGVKRFVFFSSAAAAGPAESPANPKTEEHPCEPVSQYGRGKLGAEKALGEMAGVLHSVILRFPAVYGPRDKDSLVLLRNLKLGVRPDFGGTFSVVYVRDAARAALMAAEVDVASGSVYFISDGQVHEYDEMGRLAGKLLGRRTVRLKVPDWALRATATVSEWFNRESSILNRDKARELSQGCWVCSPQKARDELGFEPEYDLERGMSETIRWYQERNWL